ncbi:MAG TPA: hypothetical protein VG870_05320 [Chitinophagaceae bacterium]|nr:hypothetical protein [Chitinophagaceae bacterium]
MHQIFFENDFENRPSSCPHCDWHGDSLQLQWGEFQELIQITELFCPECNRYLGFIQHNFSINSAE